MRILVTGAAGSVGAPLVERLRGLGHNVFATDLNSWLDISSLDVTSTNYLRWLGHANLAPDVVMHLAGAKHAPEGEEAPEHVAAVNIGGTANVLRYFRNAKIVLASTCKACDPETVYGASKLIAERMVLNAGGVVARFYNVRETAGNVFRLWEQQDPSEPIRWTDCYRYFITLDQALDLLVASLDLAPGRWTVKPGAQRHMADEAQELYPERQLQWMERRRGDRKREPLHARHEQFRMHVGEFVQIVGAHDPVLQQQVAA